MFYLLHYYIYHYYYLSIHLFSNIIHHLSMFLQVMEFFFYINILMKSLYSQIVNTFIFPKITI